jgi:hypothetical protein
MANIPRKCAYCYMIYWCHISDQSHGCLIEKEILEEVYKDIDRIPEKKPEEVKPQKQKYDHICKLCQQSFTSNHKHLVYCSPKCRKNDEIKMANDKWLKRDVNKVKKAKIPGYKVNEILEKKSVYYSEPKWIKKFKSVRG